MRGERPAGGVVFNNMPAVIEAGSQLGGAGTRMPWVSLIIDSEEGFPATEAVVFELVGYVRTMTGIAGMAIGEAEVHRTSVDLMEPKLLAQGSHAFTIALKIPEDIFPSFTFMRSDRSEIYSMRYTLRIRCYSATLQNLISNEHPIEITPKVIDAPSQMPQLRLIGAVGSMHGSELSLQAKRNQFLPLETVHIWYTHSSPPQMGILASYLELIQVSTFPDANGEGVAIHRTISTFELPCIQQGTCRTYALAFKLPLLPPTISLGPANIQYHLQLIVNFNDGTNEVIGPVKLFILPTVQRINVPQGWDEAVETLETVYGNDVLRIRPTQLVLSQWIPFELRDPIGFSGPAIDYSGFTTYELTARADVERQARFTAQEIAEARRELERELEAARIEIEREMREAEEENRRLASECAGNLSVAGIGTMQNTAAVSSSSNGAKTSSGVIVSVDENGPQSTPRQQPPPPPPPLEDELTIPHLPRPPLHPPPTFLASLSRSPEAVRPVRVSEPGTWTEADEAALANELKETHITPSVPVRTVTRKPSAALKRREYPPPPPLGGSISSPSNAMTTGSRLSNGYAYVPVRTISTSSSESITVASASGVRSGSSTAVHSTAQSIISSNGAGIITEQPKRRRWWFGGNRNKQQQSPPQQQQQQQQQQHPHSINAPVQMPPHLASTSQFPTLSRSNTSAARISEIEGLVDSICEETCTIYKKEIRRNYKALMGLRERESIKRRLVSETETILVGIFERIGEVSVGVGESSKERAMVVISALEMELSDIDHTVTKTFIHDKRVEIKNKLRDMTTTFLDIVPFLSDKSELDAQLTIALKPIRLDLENSVFYSGMSVDDADRLERIANDIWKDCMEFFDVEVKVPVMRAWKARRL